MFNDLTFAETLKMVAPIIVIELLLMVLGLYRLYKDKVKFLPKWCWALIIIFIQVLGPIIFLFIGRERD